MFLLPFEDITYKTRLKEDEVIKRLSDFIEPPKTNRFGTLGVGSVRPYEGKIDGEEFTIRRIVEHRNSFLPKINGTIEKDYVGTIVRVKMRIDRFVVVFMVVWLGGVGVALTSFVTDAIDNAEFNPSVFVLSGMFLFGCVLALGGFKSESIKSKKQLKELFEAEIVEE
jgi:hypothetical protein